jgi:hypothetical protein
MYALLLERGEYGGVEDAYVQVNDIGGKPVDLMIGQFQLSDPLFKREVRLMFEDYAAYRARIGEEPMNLTYDRGAMAVADVAGFTLTAMITNGNGIGPAQADRHFDNGAGKVAAFRASREVIPALRLGGFVLASRHASDGFTNSATIIGADGTLGIGPLELNAQYLRREDDDPLFNGAAIGTVTSEGGFAESASRAVSSAWVDSMCDSLSSMGGSGGRRRASGCRAGGGGRPRRASGARFGGVAALEALHAAGGVDQLLLAGEERVAVVADLQPQLVLGRLRLEGVAAGTDGGHRVQLGVDVLLHGGSFLPSVW